ncbi:hypothetical protein VPH35_024857 [Triticum aestivum]
MDQYEGESWRPENREGSIFFPAEGWRRGEPKLRPELGRCVLRRTAGMYRLEEKLRGRALVGTVEGNRPPVSLAQMVAALEAQCGVRREDVMVEVCSPPADFLVRFRSGDDCTRVLIYHSCKLTVGGETIQFCRWHLKEICPRGNNKESSMKFLTRLSFDGLPLEAWEVEFVTNLVSSLGGDLVKMLKPTDRCFVVVEAWMKNPNKLPKLYEVELPEPELRQDDPTSDSDVPISPPSSRLKDDKPTVVHFLNIHVLKVIDHSPILTELPPAYDYDEESNSARCHTFTCYPGTIDGAERAYIGGGHGFAGPGSDGRAGALFRM